VNDRNEEIERGRKGIKTKRQRVREKERRGHIKVWWYKEAHI
jgi:hypothetical protein